MGQQRTEPAATGKSAIPSTLFKGLILGFVTAIVGLLINTPFGVNLEENFGLDWLFGLRGKIQAPNEVVVISIDQASADALGLPNKPWKWPRALHASLIQKLVQANVRVIAFDVFFEEPQLPRDDLALARAIEKAGNVLLFEYLETIPRTREPGDALTLQIEKLKPPIPILAQSAAGLAPFPLPAVPEKKAQVWAFKPGAGDVPTLPVVAFQIFALDAVDALLTLLQEADKARAAELMTDSGGVSQTQGIQELMQSLRDIFQTDRLIAESMLQSLENPPRPDFSEERKQVLTSLIKMYQGQHSLYLNYYGPPQSITTVPYHKALEDLEKVQGRVNFDGKAVFVGASELSPGQKDGFHTPFTSSKSGLKISGVEIAATAFANLLQGSYVRPLNPIGIVLAWGLLLGIVCRLPSPTIAIAATLVISGCYIFTAYFLFKSFVVWSPLVVPLMIQSPLALFAAVLWRYIDTNRERRNIRQALGYYLPQKVADQLVDDVSNMRASELMYGTCLCTDAEQYTSVSERMDPQELWALMNSYYEAVFQPVRHHKGIVSDVVGDSMLAIWATSNPDIDLRTQACHASLDIVTAVERFNRSSAGPKLPTRIGLHSGRMLLGGVGALDHFEFRAVGDIVNTSTRIEGLNKKLGTNILLSQEVLDGLEGFVSREIGTFLLVGKSKPIVLHELICRTTEVMDDQIRLCRAFSHALGAFKVKRWEDAGLRFSELLHDHGTDTPSRFYVKLCHEYSQDPTAAASNGAISIGTK